MSRRRPHPSWSVPDRRRAPLLVGLLVLALGLFVALSTVAGLKTSAAPEGVVSLELAWHVGRARAVLHSWTMAGWDRRAGFNLGLDFLFIPAYTAAFALGCGCLADLLRQRRERGGSIPTAVAGAAVGMLAWLQPVAGLLDVAEDVFLFRVMQGPIRGLDVRAASWCATFKFAFAIPGGLLALVGLLAQVVHRVRLRGAPSPSP